MSSKTNNSELLLKAIKSRKTTYEFSNKKVNDKDIMQILEAARWSPSPTNTQPWHFIIVKDKTRISKMMKTAHYGSFHENPNIVIACILLFPKFGAQNNLRFRGLDSSSHRSHICVGIAAYNICLEAHALGISSCLLTPEDKNIKKMLKVQGEDVVPIIVGLGYEKKGTISKPRTRIELKDLISYENF